MCKFSVLVHAGPCCPTMSSLHAMKSGNRHDKSVLYQHKLTFATCRRTLSSTFDIPFPGDGHGLPKWGIVDCKSKGSFYSWNRRSRNKHYWGETYARAPPSPLRHTCTHTHMHTHTRARTHGHTHACARTHARARAHTHTHTHTHTHGDEWTGKTKDRSVMNEEMAHWTRQK